MTSAPFRFDIFEQCALDSAQRIKKVHSSGAPSFKRKPDGSFVTEVEGSVSKFLERELLAALPGSALLSEEEADHSARLHTRYVWILDPVDGTREFVKGIPEFAFSLGLVEAGVPIWGAVINPATDEGGIGGIQSGVRFWGLKQKTQQSELQICVSRSETERGLIAPFNAHLSGINSVGSVAYKLMLVAGGTYDLFFTRKPKNEWDICGGVALLKAQNQIYVDSLNKEPNFNQKQPQLKAGAIAGPPEHIQTFFHLLKEKNLSLPST